ncbi:hypothetical protein OJ997_25085 [Solirubrobacter phytolaccae]|uniref:Uncharacterized protein n=1 Tax=Solirubrobacter phytolaccae TaxID=1404360 RepID=A0A9X3NBZ4_9ACTN|nr:hypothetical protein [Solirubrobacter phytolaccae]MDA0183608.1 hypothetical protein [Solirubrobacter phytolaccae]
MRSIGVFLTAVVATLALAGTADARIAFQRGDRIYVARDDGSGVKRLTRGHFPVLSPDGRWVAFYRTASRGLELRLMRATGGASKRIALTSEGGHLTFSPDSKRLAMMVRYEVWLVDVASRRKLARLPYSARGLSFSPDSQSLVFAGSESLKIDDPSDLFTFRLGEPPHQLTRDGRSRWPLWTSQGIVFTQQTVRGGGKFPLYELWETQADGTGLRALTNQSVPITDDITYGPAPVARSLDGSRLLISVAGQSRDDAYALDLTTGAARPFGEGLVPLALSRDGASALLQTRGSDPTDQHSLVRADWLTGTRTTLIRNAMWGSWTG